MAVRNDEANNQAALERLSTFEANYGGTEILNPLKATVEQCSNTGKKLRIFLLTDGEVSNGREITDFVKENSEMARVFTFGIGKACDKKLCRDIAY